jgi:hypothetical protein
MQILAERHEDNGSFAEIDFIPDSTNQSSGSCDGFATF